MDTHDILKLFAPSPAAAMPDGWGITAIEQTAPDRHTVALAGAGSTLTLSLSPKSTSSPAHCRTRRLNLLVTATGGFTSRAALEQVLRAIFALASSNDPAGISADNLRDDSPRANASPIAKAMKPAAQHTHLTPLSSYETTPPSPRYPQHYDLLTSKELSRIEKALFISDPYDLKYSNMAPFDRLYFGNEFCHHLLPSPDQLEKTLEFSRRFNMPLTLVTPFCPDDALPAVAALLDILPPASEVVFNDFGVFTMLRVRNLVPVHGRLLCHAKKDPRSAARPESAKYHRTHNLQKSYQQFLAANGISRMELDNLPQGLDLKVSPGISTSLYYPFISSAVTRKCARANIAARTQKFVLMRQCDGCRDTATHTLPLENTTIHMQGNAHFFINEKLPDTLRQWRTDRIIYMPEIPNHNRFAQTGVCYMDWSNVYDTKDLSRLWGVEPETALEEILSALAPKPGAKLLDNGCGAARNFPIYQKHKLNITGIDISASAIARARAAAPTAQLHTGDILTHDFANKSFDIITDIGCLHTLPPWRRAAYAKKISTLLKPRGTLILAAWESFTNPAPVYYVIDQIPEWGATGHEIHELFTPKFTITNEKRRTGANQDFLFWTLLKNPSKK